MKSEEEAQRAMDYLDGSQIDGKSGWEISLQEWWCMCNECLNRLLTRRAAESQIPVAITILVLNMIVLSLALDVGSALEVEVTTEVEAEVEVEVEAALVAIIVPDNKNVCVKK